MSATLDAGRVAAFLENCPAIAVEGRTHPLVVESSPGLLVDAAVSSLLPRTSGNLLCFLPGAPEIRRALPGVRAAAPGVDVVELHGSLDAGGQDAALRQTGGRRVILATNIAETSLTVPGVSAVVDTGLQKLPRYDVERGFDHLRLERITQDSADQRAGRAGRLGPGIAVRLWDQRDRLRPHREPDIARIDLAAPVLDVLAWGGDPGRFEWFEAPSPEMLEAALALLRRLRALDDGRLTSLGERLRGLPLHPRLGAVLIEGRGSFEAAAACALLADGVRGRAVIGRHDDQRRPVGPRRVGAAAGAAEAGSRPARRPRPRLAGRRSTRARRRSRVAPRPPGRLSRPRRQATRGRLAAPAAGDGRRRRTGPRQRRPRCRMAGRARRCRCDRRGRCPGVCRQRHRTRVAGTQPEPASSTP